MTFGDKPFLILGEDRPSRIVITCDHASNRVPKEVCGGDLGVAPGDMERHIAYDVGAAGVSERLGELLNAPVFLSNFSRLVIDPNRGEDDPTLIMQLYDGSIIPGNRHLCAEEKAWRMRHLYYPYHEALAQLIESRESPVILAVHSFTPQLSGYPPRPWHVGILHEKDQRLARPMLARLRAEHDLCVGENEPYGGHLDGDSIDRHCLAHGHPNILFELRNDLIRTPQTQIAWAERLAPMITEVLETTKIS